MRYVLYDERDDELAYLPHPDRHDLGLKTELEIKMMKREIEKEEFSEEDWI